MTHLCAPTFVLLAGVSLAIAVENRRAKGDSTRAIDRYILVRGVLILAFEVLWMSPVLLEPGRVLLQVLYAIGGSLVCMAGLRRLSDRALAAFGFAIIVFGELGIGRACSRCSVSLRSPCSSVSEASTATATCCSTVTTARSCSGST